MSETPGAVIRVDDRYAYVEIGPRSVGCGRCHEVGGCGGSRREAHDNEKRTFRVRNDIGVHPGDEVMLTVPQGALLKASAFAYFFPVLLIIFSAWVGMFFSEAVAVAGAFSGFALGVAIARYGQMRLLAAGEPLLHMRIKSCAFHSPKESNSC